MSTPTPTDRRHRRRFDLRLDLRCRLLESGEVLTGRTCDISSTGVRFHLDRDLPLGRQIQLSVAWPVSLEDRWPLRLAVQGQVIRCDRHGIVMRISRHEFRLQGTTTPDTDAAPDRTPPGETNGVDCVEAPDRRAPSSAVVS